MVFLSKTWQLPFFFFWLRHQNLIPDSSSKRTFFLLSFVIRAKKIDCERKAFSLDSLQISSTISFLHSFLLNKSNLFILCHVKNGNGVLEVLHSNYSVQSVWQAKVSHIFYWLQEISNGKLPLLNLCTT